MKPEDKENDITGITFLEIEKYDGNLVKVYLFGMYILI